MQLHHGPIVIALQVPKPPTKMETGKPSEASSYSEGDGPSNGSSIVTQPGIRQRKSTDASVGSSENLSTRVEDSKEKEAHLEMSTQRLNRKPG